MYFYYDCYNSSNVLQVTLDYSLKLDAITPDLDLSIGFERAGYSLAKSFDYGQSYDSYYCELSLRLTNAEYFGGMCQGK